MFLVRFGLIELSEPMGRSIGVLLLTEHRSDFRRVSVSRGSRASYCHTELIIFSIYTTGMYTCVFALVKK